MTKAERDGLEAGPRSPVAFTLHRAQIVLASARGEHVPAITRSVGCDEQPVRNAATTSSAVDHYETAEDEHEDGSDKRVAAAHGYPHLYAGCAVFRK